MKLKVFAGLQEESNSGWMWIPQISGIHSRDHVKVTQAKHSVICIARLIDENFVKRYNHSPRKKIRQDGTAIVISEYYRDKLGAISTETEYHFRIKRIGTLNLVSKTRALLQHPDNTSKIAGWLAIVSIILSFVGLLVTLCGLLWPSTR